MVRNFCRRPSLGLWGQKFLKVVEISESFFWKKVLKIAITSKIEVIRGVTWVQNFLHTSYLRAKCFFWRAEISTPIFENFHLWDFFSKKSILPYTSNQPKIAANEYFWPRLKIFAQLCEMSYGVQKFLSEISTGVRNFCQSLTKMKKKRVSTHSILTQKFLHHDRNFCRKSKFGYYVQTYSQNLNRL